MKRKSTETFCALIMYFFAMTIVFWSPNAFAGPVPATGQTTCYNNTNEINCPSSGEPFFGQDASYTTIPPSYTKLDASGNDLPNSATSWVMVRDNVSGLIWEVKQAPDGSPNYKNPHDADNTYSWYDSNPATNGGNAGRDCSGTDTEDFINDLNAANYGGFSNWRLPSVRELSWITDKGTSAPAINTDYFPNAISSGYWSSSTFVYNTENAWLVGFGNGNVGYDYKFYSFSVRAVRGGQSELAGDFVNNGDSTITDISSGLMWQENTGGLMTWEQALTYCEGLTLGGYDDWRLPNANELQSLVYYNQGRPDTGFYYWSSTTYVYDATYAWVVYFNYGKVDSYYKLDRYYVRAVRGEQGGSSGHSGIQITGVMSDLAANPQPGEPFRFKVFAVGLQETTLNYRFYYKAGYGTPAWSINKWQVVQEWSPVNYCDYSFAGAGNYYVISHVVPAGESWARGDPQGGFTVVVE